jgi:uncharacterized protein (UPF0332 family)
MAGIKWCLNQKAGIKLVEPNDNLANSYLKMAENALGTMNRERNYNLQFAISACYYAMYYSLYSVLYKIGIKCEIHSCTLEFMKFALMGYYSEEDYKIIKKGFDLRIISQYYADKVLDSKDVDIIMGGAPLFFSKSKEVLSKINESDVDEIKSKVEKLR